MEKQHPGTILVFTYDIHASPVIMHRYAPKGRFYRVARVLDHKLTFDKYFSPARSSLADIVPAKDSVVWGVIWELFPSELKRLDENMGCPLRYHRKVQQVIDRGEWKHKTQTYVISVKDKKPDNQPSLEYLNWIVQGAKQWGLPDEWLAFLGTFSEKASC